MFLFVKQNANAKQRVFLEEYSLFCVGKKGGARPSCHPRNRGFLHSGDPWCDPCPDPWWPARNLQLEIPSAVILYRCTKQWFSWNSMISSLLRVTLSIFARFLEISRFFENFHKKFPEPGRWRFLALYGQESPPLCRTPFFTAWHSAGSKRCQVVGGTN